MLTVYHFSVEPSPKPLSWRFFPSRDDTLGKNTSDQPGRVITLGSKHKVLWTNRPPQTDLALFCSYDVQNDNIHLWTYRLHCLATSVSCVEETIANEWRLSCRCNAELPQLTTHSNIQYITFLKKVPMTPSVQQIWKVKNLTRDPAQ